ncbi:hypothetical protein [Corynebacterium halotolerans]|uniref:hypothetical protein n=1 Tax=Corynebacterium halotolerans TaxID=225326 RepID=UPI003CF2DEC3
MLSLTWLSSGATGLTRPFIAALMALAAALGIDIDTADYIPAPQEQTVSSAPSSTSSRAGEWSYVKTPNGKNLVGGDLKAWEQQKQTGPKTLQIGFSGPDRACTPYRVEVQETDTTVQVNLYADAVQPDGKSPRSTDPDVCKEAPKHYYIEVETSDPIGKREIVQQL